MSITSCGHNTADYDMKILETNHKALITKELY